MVNNHENFYYYKFYGIGWQINKTLPGFTALENTDNFDLKVSLNCTEELKDPELLWLSDLNWQSMPKIEPKFNLILSQVTTESLGKYYKICYRIKQEFVEYIFDAQGNEIWGFYSQEYLFNDAISFLLGYVLGNVIRIRGDVAFHASAIAIAGRAILFTGDSGAGKSTTAAALSRIGYPVLADDIAVIKSINNQYWVQPGYPRLRLFPKSVKAFDTSPKELTKVASLGRKRYLQLTSDNTSDWLFQDQPLPLARIYILEKRNSQLKHSSVKSLTSSQAIKKLIPNLYGSCFVKKDRQIDEFQQIVKFVKQVSVKQLSRPNNLSNLDQLCNLIVKDSLLT